MKLDEYWVPERDGTEGPDDPLGMIQCQGEWHTPTALRDFARDLLELADFAEAQNREHVVEVNVSVGDNEQPIGEIHTSLVQVTAYWQFPEDESDPPYVVVEVDSADYNPPPRVSIYLNDGQLVNRGQVNGEEEPRP